MTTKNIKYWLKEKELKTPEHDEMVLWSFANAEKILDDLKFLEGDYFYRYEGTSDSGSWNWEKKEYIVLDNLEDYRLKDFEDEKKEVEEDYEVFLQDIEEDPNRVIKKEWKGEMIKKHIEYSIPNKYYLAFTDLMFELRFYSFSSKYFNFGKWNKPYKVQEKAIYLEIKPRIKSIGEVMRQINYYKKVLENQDAIFIIVTKTKGLKEIFKSQGVLVYEYNEINESQKSLKHDI